MLSILEYFIFFAPIAGTNMLRVGGYIRAQYNPPGKNRNPLRSSTRGQTEQNYARDIPRSFHQHPVHTEMRTEKRVYVEGHGKSG